MKFLKLTFEDENAVCFPFGKSHTFPLKYILSTLLNTVHSSTEGPPEQIEIALYGCCEKGLKTKAPCNFHMGHTVILTDCSTDKNDKDIEKGVEKDTEKVGLLKTMQDLVYLSP